ncbi:hypothetical protein FACS189449_09370 [Alphaproteobacteria bacterium]|nr:hypothetical protein FACS189449_09370 [Alphaproteobacteria bacterium]
MAGSIVHIVKGRKIMLKDLILSEKTKGTIAIIAAIVMYFTPDYIDAIIEAGLAAIGISKLVIKEEE